MNAKPSVAVAIGDPAAPTISNGVCAVKGLELRDIPRSERGSRLGVMQDRVPMSP